jgi:hypothetical protein
MFAGALVKPLAYVFFLRPRNTSSVPESNASALPAEPTPISGTAPMASAEEPITSNVIPRIFDTFPSTKSTLENYSRLG